MEVEDFLPQNIYHRKTLLYDSLDVTVRHSPAQDPIQQEILSTKLL